MEPLLKVNNLSKSFQGVQANDDVCFDVRPGEIHGLIGPNGAGKTTLLSLLSGEITPDRGSVSLQQLDITHMPAFKRIHLGLARSYQISRLFPQMTCLQNVQVSLQIQQGHSFRFFSSAFSSHQDEAMKMLQQLGLEEQAHKPAGDLAHGLRRELELAVILARKPRLLMLDEPMAGMGKSESQRITSVLEGLRGDMTMLLVEHDMDVVFQLADRISVLVQGKVMVTGTAEDIRAHEAVQAAYLGDDL
jgi:branched-chain amino acid transport system ATP-binding protein